MSVTGHIGCGKSTELLRLKDQLEQQGLHVVYFEPSQDLDRADVALSCKPFRGIALGSEASASVRMVK